MGTGDNSQFVVSARPRNISRAISESSREAQLTETCCILPQAGPSLGPAARAAPRERRLILLPAVELLRSQVKLDVIAFVLGDHDERIFELAVDRERVYGTGFRDALVSDLVSADIPDGDFSGEIVLVAPTVLDFVDVDVAFAGRRS